MLGLLRLGQLAALAALIALGASGCGQECRDQDGDGRGEGCEKGPDCDDDNSRLGERCDAVAQMCALDRTAEGCPCLSSAHTECYSGPEETAAVGICRAGQKRCVNRKWSACEGEQAPGFERCNDRDDDCDGLSDEGVLSPCGGCDASCGGGVWGPPTVPFELDDAEGLALTQLGELTLTRERTAHAFVWVPNTGEGTLSKVDAERAVEVARYRVPGEPERIAVDHLGDAWVLSPALDGDSMLTKVAGDIARCAQGDGAPLTSSGPEDVLPFGEDDCVLWSVAVGERDGLARSLAIDGTADPDVELGGHAWVGMQHEERVLQLDSRDGALLRELQTPGIEPYSAAFDPWGQLWVVDRKGLLARIDLRPESPEVEVLEAPLRCYELESIASDEDGVLTLSGFSCEDVVSYDPARKQWHWAKTEGVLDTRGIAVLGEDAWVTHTGGSLSRVQRDPLVVGERFELRADGVSPIESTAIAVDALGMLWIASSLGGGDQRGVLSRFDPMEQVVTAQVQVGRSPRVHGDLTGDRLFAVTAAEGTVEHVFRGCGVSTLSGVDGGELSASTIWERVHLSWMAGPGASVTLQARQAASEEELAEAEYVDLGTLPDEPPPYDLAFPRGGAVQVRITIQAGARIGAPRILRVGVQWECPGPD